MTNHKKSNILFDTAKRCVAEAELEYKERKYSLAIRRAQEAVELSLKAVLIILGIEYPKKHDVGKIFLKAVTEKLSAEFHDDAKKLAEDSEQLSEEREAAFYGDKWSGLQEYDVEDVETSIDAAKLALKFIEKVYIKFIHQD